MSKPNDVTEDAWDKAMDVAWVADGTDHPFVVEPIARALDEAQTKERQRCLDICAAEREWCSGIEEVQLLIASGGPARIIPGWNAPSEDE